MWNENCSLVCTVGSVQLCIFVDDSKDQLIIINLMMTLAYNNNKTYTTFPYVFLLILRLLPFYKKKVKIVLTWTSQTDNYTINLLPTANQPILT